MRHVLVCSKGEEYICDTSTQIYTRRNHYEYHLKSCHGKKTNKRKTSRDSEEYECSIYELPS